MFLSLWSSGQGEQRDQHLYDNSMQTEKLNLVGPNTLTQAGYLFLHLDSNSESALRLNYCPHLQKRHTGRFFTLYFHINQMERLHLLQDESFNISGIYLILFLWNPQQKLIKQKTCAIFIFSIWINSIFIILYYSFYFIFVLFLLRVTTD